MPPSSRSPSPLATRAIDAIWTAAAERLGLVVVRTSEVYASADGRGRISIGVDEILDADDAFAQLLFHELCHAITEGQPGRQTPDWGLENGPVHATREHACLRFGAWLAGRFDLRTEMAPTTEYRAYYDSLPPDPLGPDPASDLAIPLARMARASFESSSWRVPIEDALAATVRLGRQRHPLGFSLGPEGETCGSCAWLYHGGRGAPVARCRQSAGAGGEGARTGIELPACVRWESVVDCRACGACCREAYHSVTVSVRDPVVWREPALIVRLGHRFEIRREGPRCAALEIAVGGGPDAGRARYSCSIYDNRPKPCREFVAGGRHCLDARRRVGLSAGAS